MTIAEIGPQQQVTAMFAGQIDVGYIADNSTTRYHGISGGAREDDGRTVATPLHLTDRRSFP
ncbi:TPA: hypothetical protein ACTXAA_002150 [Raoultella planticola]|uniref:hypothetical protein n=1 Tax=Raoultella planticola TaxID=575 RepID=UPI001D0CF7DE|nr:hypothetical protein [Raoultella planticola]